MSGKTVWCGDNMYPKNAFDDFIGYRIKEWNEMNEIVLFSYSDIQSNVPLVSGTYFGSIIICVVNDEDDLKYLKLRDWEAGTLQTGYIIDDQRHDSLGVITKIFHSQEKTVLKTTTGNLVFNTVYGLTIDNIDSTGYVYGDSELCYW